jgi:hypothetical protein
VEPQAVSTTSPPVPAASKGVIAICVVAGALALSISVQAIVKMQKELRADEAEELLDIDDRGPAELEAERLLHETERLATEKAQLQRECVELEERLAALAARAPQMPLIQTVVASAEGDRVIGLAAGSDDKVERGYQFAIRRDDKIIARVVASVVGERGCACRILIVRPGIKIREGDLATTKLD